MNQAIREAGRHSSWASAPLEPDESGEGLRRSPGSVRIIVNGQDAVFERPVVVTTDGDVELPLPDTAAALSYGLIDLGQGAVQLISPRGDVTLLTASTQHPYLTVTARQLEDAIGVRARYDIAQRTLVIDTGAVSGFQVYTEPKPQEQLEEEASLQRIFEQAARIPETSQEIPPEARPEIDLEGQVSYSYRDPRFAPPFRNLRTTVTGRVYDADIAFETQRQDQSGIFDHDYTYLNVRQGDWFVGLFDQQVNLAPLRTQFENFSGVKVKKVWGEPVRPGGEVQTAVSPGRTLEPRPSWQSTTTFSGGRYDVFVNGGPTGLVKYLGELYEARQQIVPAKWLLIEQALLYTRSEADLPERALSTSYPRRNLVSFSSAEILLPHDVSLSGQAARASYAPDANTDERISDWDWRTALSWQRPWARTRLSYEYVGKDYVSLGNPGIYQDYSGLTAYANLYLTDRWSLSSQLVGYRDNVDRTSTESTNPTVSFSMTSANRLLDEHQLTLNYQHILFNPYGPGAVSSSHTDSYRADYTLPFVGATHLLAGYQYQRIIAPAAADTLSHTGRASLIGSYGRGSSWYLSQDLLKNVHEDASNTLSLTTSFDVTHVLRDRTDLYLNSSYSRGATQHVEAVDTLSGALGLRTELGADTALTAEYAVNTYDLDRERWNWPRDWSVLFSVSQRFGVATSPTFGSIDGYVFYDLNASGRWDPGEPVAEDVTIRLGEGRQAATDVQGKFLLTRVVPGSRVLEVDLASLDPVWVSPEPRRQVVVKKRRPTTVTFGLIKGGAIRGTVFIDENQDGRFQDTEEPLEGVTVILRPQETFRRTDADGVFQFDHLLPGRYLVSAYPESLPTGYALASEAPWVIDLAAGQEAAGTDVPVRLLTEQIQRFE